ncbi:tRNA1(Val) (adenine(37)-N6)-methyltransferase [Hoeflea alexandrii]|uniref:tRNA1(Val) (adenine(37)-N6)-methyltransferase n=1 Tax=Hoeflea alexandrii TaxID=288436 RepID=UPI003D2F8190
MTQAPDKTPPEPAPGQPANGCPADAHAGAAAVSGYTVDAFHNGKFFLVQPADTGHRAGMDAMLLAATVPDGASGVLADLGAGAGAAGLAAISRLPGLSAVLIERAPVMAECARRSLALAGNAHLAPRARVIEADVTLQGRQRLAAGLADQAFDYAILNPPFNAGADRKTPDPLKAEAHAMDSQDLFERWLRTAAAILKPGGQVSIIARPESMAGILAALGNRFGGIEVIPVVPRPADDAIRILVTAIKGSRARMSLRDRILIHEGSGNAFSGQMHDLGNGRAAWPRRTRNRRPK